jgi:hypothetical protein
MKPAIVAIEYASRGDLRLHHEVVGLMLGDLIVPESIGLSPAKASRCSAQRGKRDLGQAFRDRGARRDGRLIQTELASRRCAGAADICSTASCAI